MPHKFVQNKRAHSGRCALVTYVRRRGKRSIQRILGSVSHHNETLGSRRGFGLFVFRMRSECAGICERRPNLGGAAGAAAGGVRAKMGASVALAVTHQVVNEKPTAGGKSSIGGAGINNSERQTYPP